MQDPNWIERILENNPNVKVCKEHSLDTPEKIQAFEDRMRKACEKGFRRNEIARAESIIAARSRIII